MTDAKKIGEVKTIPSIQQIEWRIPDYFLVAQDKKFICLFSSTFPVTGALWHLRLYPCEGQLFLVSKEYPGSPFGYLAPDAHREYSLEYDFGLKKCDGTVEYLVNGIVRKDETRNNNNFVFIKKIQLLKRKSELVPDNVLTIVCAMKWVDEASQSSTQSETGVDNRTKALKLIRLDKLSENLKDLIGDKETCDTTLKVKDREYKAHRLILMARSAVFAATFKHDTLERQTGVITISDCDPDSFQLFLDYLYRGQLEELTFHNALNLYYISDKYDVEELKQFCAKYLRQYLTVENICEIVVFADKYNEMELLSAIQNFFNKNYFAILLTSDWDNLLATNHFLANKLLKEMSKAKGQSIYKKH